MKTIGQFKDSVAGILTGTNLNNVTDLDGVLERAARTLVQQVDIPEASNVEEMTLYAGVIDYGVPDTIFGTSIFDLRPQGISRNESDAIYKKIGVIFDRQKNTLENGYTVAFEYRDGLAVMRVDQTKISSKADLDDMTDDDWTLSGSASNLAIDETVFYKSPSSLRFTATGASAAVMTKAIDSQDLSDYDDVGVAFLAIRVPSGTDLTSIQLKLGSSATAYNDVTVTEGFLGEFKSDRWQLVAFDFSGATQTGTPDWSAIDYAEITFNTAATEVNVRVGALFISLPSPHELVFASAAIFMDENGALSNTITSDNDQIVLNDSAYTLFQHQAALDIATDQGKKGKVASETFTLHDVKTGLYPLYRSDNPSQKIKSTGSYYNVRGWRGNGLRRT